MTEPREKILYPYWQSECYTWERISPAWQKQTCKYCGWEWAFSNFRSEAALAGRLALHLVECHVNVSRTLYMQEGLAQ
jgi:hypothetical protein